MNPTVTAGEIPTAENIIVNIEHANVSSLISDDLPTVYAAGNIHTMNRTEQSCNLASDRELPSVAAKCQMSNTPEQHSESSNTLTEIGCTQTTPSEDHPGQSCISAPLLSKDYGPTANIEDTDLLKTNSSITSGSQQARICELDTCHGSDEAANDKDHNVIIRPFTLSSTSQLSSGPPTPAMSESLVLKADNMDVEITSLPADSSEPSDNERHKLTQHESFVAASGNGSEFIGPILPRSVDSQAYADDVPMLSEQDENYAGVTTNDHRYHLSTTSVPKLVCTASSEFRGFGDENFLRGCKWSPDGICIVTNSNDNCLRTFHPFRTTESSSTFSDNELVPKVKMKESGQIYDYTWHPRMSAQQSDFCRIACTCSGIPIHLWDAESGKIVTSYRAYDQFDEITAAYSVSFSIDGSKIYAGYNKAIRIFDTDYPVRSCKTVKTFNSQKKDGQTGIISCFTHSPDGNGLYVAGSYSRHIGIYDSTCDKLVCLMQGQHGGVTHLKFSPDATKLYSGGRKDAEILCWDMRNMGRILFSALREVRTNQRIYFDLSQSGRYLVSGNQDGTVAFWDTVGSVEEVNGDSFLKPCSQFQAHKDCVNGVSFNPKRDMIATASGQRHFRNFEMCDSDDSSDETEMETSEPWDFSLTVWQIPLL